MNYYVDTQFDNGSGMKFKTKEDLLEEIGLMIDDCIENEGTYFAVTVDSDASCFYNDEDEDDYDDEDEEDE